MERIKQGPRWFSIAEAAEYLDVGEQTIYRWMRDEAITYRKVGDSTRFLQEDLDAVVQVRWSKTDAERIRGVCPVCRHEQLVEGELQSTGMLYFKPKHTKFWTLKDSNVEVTARICCRCGHITAFGDLQKLNALSTRAKGSDK